MKCSKCGANLESDSVFCTSCGTKVEVQKIIVCTKCGSELKDDDLFCRECGAKVSEPVATECKIEQKINSEFSTVPKQDKKETKYVVSTEKKKFKVTYLILIVVCVVVVLCSVVVKNYIKETNVTSEFQTEKAQNGENSSDAELGQVADKFAQKDAEIHEEVSKDVIEANNKRLNIYEQLMAKLPQDLKESLKQLEFVFGLFIDREMTFVCDTLYNREIHGTSGDLEATSYRATLIQEHTKELEQYLKAIANNRSSNNDANYELELTKLDSVYSSLLALAKTDQKHIGEYSDMGATKLMEVNQRKELQEAQDAWIAYDKANIEFLEKLSMVSGISVEGVRRERIRERIEHLKSSIDQARETWTE